ncbi:hypothetical protein BC831DRAFT_461762 [Entophlyctis helioformis]|nr:hypothetical protein BC831DRAFT_461762 [Entophlyctis helioformis]
MTAHARPHTAVRSSASPSGALPGPGGSAGGSPSGAASSSPSASIPTASVATSTAKGLAISTLGTIAANVANDPPKLSRPKTRGRLQQQSPSAGIDSRRPEFKSNSDDGISALSPMSPGDLISSSEAGWLSDKLKAADAFLSSSGSDTAVDSNPDIASSLAPPSSARKMSILARPRLASAASFAANSLLSQSTPSPPLTTSLSPSQPLSPNQPPLQPSLTAQSPAVMRNVGLNASSGPELLPGLVKARPSLAQLGALPQMQRRKTFARSPSIHRSNNAGSDIKQTLAFLAPSANGPAVARGAAPSTPVQPPAAAETRTEPRLRRVRSHQIEPFIIEHWRIAFTYFRIANQLKRTFESVHSRVQSVFETPLKEPGGLSFLLRLQLQTSDSSMSQKICKLLEPQDRSRETLDAVQRLLAFRVRSFAQFALDQRLRFCMIMQYEKFPKQTVIVKEGHNAWSFYFILNGQVEIFMVKNGYRNRLNVLNTGDSLGPPCRKLAMLSTIPVFQTTPEFPENAANLFEIITYEPNETIIYEGTEAGQLFWILKGTCRCVKVVPFVQKKVKVGFSTMNKHLTPYNPSMTLAADEEIIQNLLTIQELEHGDHFPGIPAYQDDDYTNEFTFKKEKYVHQLELEDPTNPKTKAGFSVVASTQVEAAVISRLDYVRAATKEMLVETLRSKNLHQVSMAQLQEAFLDKWKWDIYKKQVVNSVQYKTHGT